MDMDFGKMMRDQVDNDSYVRWSTRYNTYQELCRWITSTLEQSGYNKLELGADIMKHLLEQLDSSKSIMENTEMGKKMKELGTE